MDNLFLYILASFGLSFLIKETEGPFGIISKIRNYLLNNKYVGVFFYKLFSCYFCLGFWCGIISYILLKKEIIFTEMVMYSLAAAVSSLIIDLIINNEN